MIVFSHVTKKGKPLKILSLIVVVAALTVSGCASNQKLTTVITPLKAIELSNETAPEAVKGVFELTVKGCDEKHRMEFLNSESDIKDQRNLIVALRPQAVKELTELYGKSPREYFMGKTIKVSGEAKRIKRWNSVKYRNHHNFFYQTQVFVNKADQITEI
jgi:hypothetical protein